MSALSRLELGSQFGVTLIQNERIRATSRRTTKAFSGYGEAAVLEISVAVGSVVGAGASLTISIDVSDDGESWESAEELEFTGQDSALVVIDSPKEYLRASWTPSPEVTRATIAKIRAVPEFINRARPIRAVAKNGLVNDLDLGDLSGNSVVVLDPRAQPWQPSHIYSMANPGTPGVAATVTPTDDPTVKFGTCYAMYGDSGANEPTWSDDGSDVDDNDLDWASTGFDPAGWQALTTYDGSKTILANGSLWSNDGAGDSGASEPDWAAHPNGFDTVTDGDLTWTNNGPAATWDADTTYRFYALADGSNYFSDWVIPSMPGDWVFGLGYVKKPFVPSGADEPDWHSAAPGSSLYATDGEILWKEDSSTPETLIVTGIVAPSDAALVTIASAILPGDPQIIKLYDEDNVVNDYGAHAESSAGNRIQRDDDSNMEIDASQQLLVAYLNGQWQPLDVGHS